MLDALRALFRTVSLRGLFVAAAVGLSTTPFPSAKASGWIVVFEDHFNQPSLDLTRWHTRFIYNGGTLDYFQNELQRYRDNNNHVLKDGVLSLVAKGPTSTGLYTSGMIRSRKTFRYGYFEARIKLPPGRGVFPAFWLNSDYDADGNLGWPPEIDIMEFAPNGVTEHPNMVHSTVQTSTPNTQGGAFLYNDTNFNTRYRFYRAPYDMTRDWHVYGLFWRSDDTVTAYLDGRKLWQRRYRWVYEDGREAGPAHILINLAVGGDWAGLGGIDPAAFPAKLQVDYVRVCQRATTGIYPSTCGGSKYAPK